jgi:hypothetical protein
MTRPRVVRILVVTALVLVAGGMAFRWVTSSRIGDTPRAKAGPGAKSEREQPRVDLGLVIWVAGPDDTSLLVVRLWSGTLRQQALDNAARTDGARRPIEPLVLSLPRASWAQARFTVVPAGTGPNDSPGRALNGAALVSAPETDRMSLGPGDTLTAQYRIPTSELPPPDSFVRVELRTERGVFWSEPIPVPRAPESERGLLIRRAEILLKLGAFGEASVAADAVIGRHQQEPAGYWIKAQAREAEGATDEALRLYRTALDKAFARPDAAGHEPPVPIIARIRMLEERRAAAGR